MPNIENQLEEVTGALAMDIDSRIYPESPWLHFPKKTAWPEEIGHVFETVKFERTAPDAAQTWQAHATADGTGNICNPPTTKLAFKTTRNAVQLESTAVETEDFCVDDMRAKYKRDEQVDLATDMLAMNIKNIWIDHYRDKYASVANRKIVLNAALTETDQSDGDAFGTGDGPATGELNNDVLDYFYQYLLVEGGRRFATTVANGQPIFTLVCGYTTSRNLIKGDANTRNDLRDSSHADKLLLALGYAHTYNGFVHAIDDTPRRHEWDGGTPQWIRHQPWTTVGGVEVANPDYESADHEDTFIYVNNVYECLVPGSIAKVADMGFTPQNYIGEVSWKNIQNRTDNVDGKNGFFRAVLGSAVRPRNTEFGIVIRHLRCPNLNLTGCA